MMDAFLVINVSSSIKFSVYVVGAGDALFGLCRGTLEGVGTRSRLRARDDRGAALIDKSFTAAEVPDLADATSRVGAWLREGEGRRRISAPGSRVTAWVIPTDEERMIATHTVALWRAHTGATTRVAAGAAP